MRADDGIDFPRQSVFSIGFTFGAKNGLLKRVMGGLYGTMKDSKKAARRTVGSRIIRWKVCPPSLHLLSIWVCGCLLCCNSVSGGSVAGDVNDSARDSWTANLLVEQVEALTVLDVAYTSSTRLSVAWDPAPNTVAAYQITASESIGSSSLVAEVDGALTSAVLANLKSDTTYEVTIRACLDQPCNETLFAQPSAVGSTAAEVWQLEGSGRGFENAHQIVNDGNVLSYVFVYGEGAPDELVGRARLRFKAHFEIESGPGVHAAISDGVVNDTLESVSVFVHEPGYQLANPQVETPLIRHLAAFQAIPLAESMGGAIRLLFEAQGGDGNNRLFYLDSQDGLVGLDYHPGEPTTVGAPGDYEVGSLTEPHVAVGVDGTGLSIVRQSKMGWPTLDTWTWDGAEGTFLIMTGADECGQTNDGLFQANWSGTEWEVARGDDDCAIPVVNSAHGPVIVHLGGTRYKLYYEDATDGRMDKPFRVIYGDTIDDIEDWESAEQAREVHFLWPDGSQLDAANEAGLGDHVIFMPTSDLGHQIMIMNLGGLDDSSNPTASLGTGMAHLVNP